MQKDYEKLGYYTNIKELVEDTRIGRPHVVILGAGASLQAFPKGDDSGQRLPLMTDIVETVGLDSIFNAQGIRYKDRNFEEIYSNLYKDVNRKYLIDTINNVIWKYFSQLKLPPYPTLYDHLVLSLREKDLIASFNWDPFLYYACWRNHQKAKLPGVVYLHGNVAIGYCRKDNARGWIESKCSKCGNKFEPSRLIYPIIQKDYLDQFILTEWETLKHALSSAYILTIFGYSAPQYDTKAIETMKGAWGSNSIRDIDRTEIIDTKGKDELTDTWKNFIHAFHYDITKDFYKSSIGLFPRRSCEAEWNYSMPEKLSFYPQNPIPQNSSLNDLWKWCRPLIEAENKKT